VARGGGKILEIMEEEGVNFLATDWE
jgi:hypothetical protein